jgi:hypothetical protein
MTAKPKPRTLAQILATAKKPRDLVKCTTCSNETVAAIVKEFAEKRAKGGTEAWQSWTWFSRVVLLDEFGVDIKPAALGNHVRNCLRIVE